MGRPIGSPVIRHVGIGGVSSGSSAPWTPLSIGSLTQWLDERDQTYVSNRLSVWGDQSNANNDMFQGTGAVRPYDGRTINGYLAPDFRGSEFIRATTTLGDCISNTGYNGFIVHLPDDSASNQTIWGDIGSNVLLRVITSGYQLLQNDGAGDATAIVASGTGTARLVEFSWNGTQISLQVDAGTAQTATSGTPSAFNQLVQMGVCDGAYATVLIFNEYLSSTNRALVRAYLAAKYGVTA